MAILLLPAFNYLTNSWEFKRKQENRTFKDSLIFDLKHLDPLPKNCEAYMNDNFTFRTPLLDIYHSIKFYLYKVSPHPDKTIIGKDGWYFSAGKEEESYEGKIDFSVKQLKEFASEWSKRKKYLDSMNIKTYWLICPMKHHIYAEKLPTYDMKEHKKPRVEKLKEYLNEKIPSLNIIYPRFELIKAKAANSVYYKLDDHWNETGGYIAANELLSRIKLDFPQLLIKSYSDYVWRDSTFKRGIHYNVLGIAELNENDKFAQLKNEMAVKAVKYGFPSPDYFPYPWDYERRYVNAMDTIGLRILLIRDSFGDQVAPFLKESFSESVFIFDGWRYDLNKKIIEKVKPDIVIYMGLETHLEHIITSY